MTQENQESPEFLFTNVGFLLAKTNQIKDRFLDQCLAKEEITSSQIKVMFALYFMRIKRSSDISKYLNVDGSSVTRMLDRLEKKQFIQRVSDPEDRRSVLIQLTEEGRDVTLRAIPLAESAIDKLTGCLTFEEKQNLLHCLGKIVDSFLAEEFPISNQKDAKC